MLRSGLGALYFGVRRTRVMQGSMPAVFLSVMCLSSPSAACLQCPHLLLHQHRGGVHSLPSRGLPETGLPGDPGMYPGSAPLTAGEPATGKRTAARRPGCQPRPAADKRPACDLPAPQGHAHPSAQSLLLAVFPAGSPTLWFPRIPSLVCGLLMWPCGQATKAFPYPGPP